MTPVVITGMHRTGTSMVAKTLRALGLYFGDQRRFLPPAPDNPEGFFEHAGFVRLSDDLLEATGGAWDHPPACGPMAADDPRVAHLRERADELIDELAITPSWAWKDPRVSLTARFWVDLLPELRFVVCLRHPLEVALSLKRRNQTSYAHGLSLWHAYYTTLLDVVPPDRRVVTHYDSHFHGGDEEVERLAGSLGLPNPVSADNPAADAKLRHFQLDVGLAQAAVATETIDLYARLCSEAGWPDATESVTTEAATVDRTLLDLVAANQQLAMRGRQIASLERDRAELLDRVADLEAAGHGSVLNEIGARLDALEDALHDLRYPAQDLAGRNDAPVIDGCRQMVRRYVARHERVLVVAKDDGLLLDLYGRPAANFPQDASGQYPGFTFAHGAAAIAHLEALRLRDHQFLLLPETACWWISRYPEFADHLLGRYQVVADEPGVGLLVDIRARRDHGNDWPAPFTEVLHELGTTCGHQPTVLDWTDSGLWFHLRDQNVFVPPPGDALPYLDHTIDVVALSDPSRMAEALRCAAVAVVTMRPGRWPTVSAVDLVSAATGRVQELVVRFVAAGDDADPAWVDGLEEALATDPAAEIAVGGDLLDDGAGEADVVAIVEPGVLPLPGCCGAARHTFARGERVGAVAPKLLAADGSLEAAGTAVFADGTWRGVAAGSHQITAPWHEYVRETRGSTGLLFVSGAAFHKLDERLRRAAVSNPMVTAAAVWAAGLRVLYQPDAWAVRAGRSSLEDPSARPLVAEVWGGLPDRPPRPPVLGETEWRTVLARDDIEAGWR